MKGFGLCLVLASLGATSCGDSGQTGSPSCAAPCQCEYLANFHLAKATVLAVDQSKVTIRVDHLLDELPGGERYDQQELTGTVPSPSWCMPTALALPNVGAEVFAAFSAYDAAVLRVQPWGDDIQLADGSWVTLADAVDLSDAPTCYARYAAPCHDTRTEGNGCALAVPDSHLDSAHGFAAALLLLGSFALLRRRRR